MLTHGIFLALNALLMLIWPFVIGHWLFRRKRLNWGLFLVGAGTFIISQLGHLPFNRWLLATVPAIQQDLALLALFAGLSAGLFEEVARFIGLRLWAQEASEWADGLMLGLGHGGIESIIVGLLAAVNGYVILNPGGALAQATVPPEQIPVLTAVLADMLARPAPLLLMGAGERLLALTMHLAMSLLVLRAVTARRLRWLGAAIALHALFDVVAVYVAGRWGVYWAEAALLVLALSCSGLIWRMRPGAKSPPASNELMEAVRPWQPPLAPQEPSREKLEDSRYN